MLNTPALWDKSLCSSGEDMSFVAFHLDASLLGKGGPVMHLQGKEKTLAAASKRKMLNNI